MSFGPVSPAAFSLDADGTPRSPLYGDVYHARAGAIAQARHVFLGGNGLPRRWQGRRRFTVLETGFGLGHNFLATWEAWRESPARPDRLEFVSIEGHPLRREDLARWHAGRHPPALQELAEALVAAWPPLTPDIHVLEFDAGRVRLLLVLADVAQALPELVVSADAFFLDGFAPPLNPRMWDARVLARLARRAAPEATVATWSASRALRDGLSAAGFVVERAPGFAGKKDMTVGRFAPRHVPRTPPGRRPFPAQRVAVVGAGLAGAGVARAMVAHGLQVEVYEAESAPARHASGNPAALFHGIVHAEDGPHARWMRACALRTQQLLRSELADSRVDGAFGLWRAQKGLSVTEMQALLGRQALPADWVQAVATPRGEAWWFPGGGWADPAAVVRSWLGTAGIVLHCRAGVADLREASEGAWQMLDAAGRLLGEADAVVLANASGAARWLEPRAGAWRRTRGQISLLSAPGLALPWPIADAGYALQLPDGRVLAGATSQPEDDDPHCRQDDHAQNLATLERLTGYRAAADIVVDGRVGWRLQTQDRMPVLGPVPVPGGGSGPVQPRLIERRPGLYSAVAYGSRGMTQAGLAGEVVAAWLTGGAMPVPARLLDAVDGARLDARLNRSSGS